MQGEEWWKIYDGQFANCLFFFSVTDSTFKEADVDGRLRSSPQNSGECTFECEHDGQDGLKVK